MSFKEINQTARFADILESMRKFSETYAERTGTFFCSNKAVTSQVILGLARHKEMYGAPLCPCRNYDDKVGEVELAYWNCPCVPMRERKECHCMLFLTKDNEFASTERQIAITDFPYPVITASF